MVGDSFPRLPGAGRAQPLYRLTISLFYFIPLLVQQMDEHLIILIHCGQILPQQRE